MTSTKEMNESVSFRIKVFLEGAYYDQTQLMDDYYRTEGLLGQIDPYGLNTTIDPSLLQFNGLDDVVDWVIVELRDASDPTQILARKATLVQRDADICDELGNVDLVFEGLSGTNFFVAVDHRFHLRVMTATALDLSLSPLIDFTKPSTPVYSLGGEAMNNIGGVMNLWSGDGNDDGRINVKDRNFNWKPENGVLFNYYTSTGDFNLDGVVNAVDMNFYWRYNNSQVEQIP